MKNTVKSIEKKIIEILKALAQKEEIDLSKGFLMLGLDSMKLMYLSSEIEEEFDVDIPLNRLVKIKDMNELVKVIADCMPEESFKDNNTKKTDLSSNREEMYEEFILTEIQQAYFYGKNSSNGVSGFSTHAYFEFIMDIDVEKFNSALNEVILRHPMLRTVILDSGMQKTLKKVDRYQIQYIDCVNCKQNVIDEKIMELRLNMSEKSVDLSKWPLFEFKALRTSEDTVRIFFGVELIILDGMSIKLFINEVMEYYYSTSLQKEPLEVTFYDYVKESEKVKNTQGYKEDEIYWNKRMKDGKVYNSPALAIRDNVKFTAYKFGRLEKRFQKDQYDKLKQLAVSNNTTITAIICTAFVTVLSKWSNQDKLTINMTTFDRSNIHKDIKKVLGDFTITMPLSVDISNNKIWDRILSVQKKIFELVEHSTYSGVKIAKSFAKSRGISTGEIFPIVFTSMLFDENIFDKAYDEFDILQYAYAVSQTPQVYLDFQVVNSKSGMLISWDYVKELFEEDYINAIFADCVNLLQAIMDDQEYDLYGEEKKFIKEYNNTEEPIEPELLHKMIEKQVRRQPDKIAVKLEDKFITYEQLWQQSKKVAGYIRTSGLGHKDFILVKASRTIQTIVNILGILMAGAAYVPIGMEWPKEREDFIKASVKSELVLDDSIVEKLEYMEGDNYDLEEVGDTGDIAYIIYTSGSTGKPKGVVITHGAVSNTIKDINNKFNVTEKDKIIGISSLCFDLSVYDVFGSLSRGAQLVLIPDILDIQNIYKTVQDEKITIWNSVPSVMDLLVECDRMQKEEEMFWESNNKYRKNISLNEYLRLVLLSGDWIKVDLPQKIWDSFSVSEVVSLGGATEASIWSIYYPIEEVKSEQKSIPYGYPLANQEFYVLNYDGSNSPIGGIGELYIGGVGVAKEYKNDTEKTQASFIEHPLYGRLYKTGDYGRFTKDGYIEFLGRKDNQVKINGHRIELGEIENCIMQLEEINNAVVIDKASNNGKALYAYYVSDKVLDENKLKNLLSTKLPAYMIPVQYIKVNEIPLSGNGKVDRNKLKQYEGQTTEGQTSESQGKIHNYTKVEKELISYCKELLAIDDFGIDDNILLLGGDSLKVIQLLAKVKNNYKIDIPLRRLFNNPTIREMANAISQSNSLEGDALKPVNREIYNVSASQNRMFILNQFDKDSITYNTTAAIYLKGKLDIKYLEAVLQQIIERHEILRTSYLLKDNVVYQKANTEFDFRLEYSNCNNQGKEVIHNTIKDFVKPFHLSEPLIIRAKLLETKKEEFILAIDSHHIAFDAISKEILIKDFCGLYNKEVLPKLNYQYKDYAQYEYEAHGKGAFAQQEKYWETRLSDRKEVKLQYDFDTQGVNSNRGDYYEIELDKSEADKLYKAAKENRVTLYMIMVAVLNIWLSKLTAGKDIIIGSPFAGRNISETENMIGMFVNTVPIRNYVADEMQFTEFLESVYNNVINDFENGTYPYNLIVEKTCKARILNSNPLFNVFFALQNMKKSDFNMHNMVVEDYDFKNRISKFDISIYAYEVDSKLRLEFEYCTELFRKDTIQLMAESIRYIAEQVTQNSNILLKDISIISKYEQKLLDKFNATKFDYACEKTLKELFEEQVKKNGSNTALRFKGKGMTYKQLNDAADQIAYRLYNLGVKVNEIVPVMTGRTFEMFIAILAVIKSGAAYLPIDPKFPKDRIEYMIKDSKAKIIVADSDDYIDYSLDIEVVNVSDWRNLNISGTTLKFNNKSSDLLYVLYTSGSTGLPKGVEISNKAVHNFMNGVFNIIDLGQCNRILAVTTISFDIFGLETVVSLCKGLEIVIADENEQRDSELLGKLIKSEQVEIMQMTPSMLKMQLREGKNNLYSSVKVLMVGGEVFSNELLKRVKAYSTWKIYNMYGPTETTIWSTISDLTEKDSVDIGQPIANTQVYIVDSTGNICPIGVPGELCISGDGLARGYHNRTELTKEKFVRGSFNSDITIYKTGDYAKWTSSGYLMCFGRIDNQVKIRGHRIELEEVEQQIGKIKGIDSAALNVETGVSGENELQAYIIMKEGYELNVKEIRSYISKMLPDYMMPAAFYKIDTMPLTNNGKVDRKKLKPFRKEPEVKLHHKGTSPANIEDTVLNIWRDILGKDDFDTSDNFFEIGGNSLAAVEIVDEVNKRLQTKFNVTEFFDYPSVASQAEYICSKGLKVSTKAPSEPGELMGSQHEHSIAVIGVACKFPESDTAEEFWDNIINKKELIHFYSKDEMLEQGVLKDWIENPSYVPAVAKLEGTDLFDAEFFGYTQKDAAYLDPQIRLFEECAWNALTDGGYNEVDENNNIGVFGGSSFNYHWINGVIKNVPEDFAQQFTIMQLNDRQFLTTQTSYKLNLKGPSYSVGSACSTSLVAIHNAYRALINQECDMALAGGVSITEFGEKGYLYEPGMILSKDGHCRPFDQNATGTVFSNGAGVILLKPLNQAVQDKDNIYAVIKGTGINNDGNQKAGFTAPSVKGERDAIKRALAYSGIKSEQISYVEAHGTGTSLGDPIEIEGLKQAFCLEEGNRCAIGSVKANIGHTDAASGVAGVIKTIYALKNKTLPPSINFEQINENIDIKNTPFYINTEAKKWERIDGELLRAGVSSFGIGGTNAHLILEEAPEQKIEEKTDTEYKVLTLSAKTEQSLKMYRKELKDFIQKHKDLSMQDLTFTMACRRKKFDFRECITFKNTEELLKKLQSDNAENLSKKEKRKIVFLFPGQGSQYIHMGEQLYNTADYIRELMDRCFRIASLYSENDYKAILFGKINEELKKELNKNMNENIHDTEIAQFLLFTIEYSLAEYLISIGIVPDVTIGHSIGEYVEAVLSGVFSLEDAIKLICHRGRYMQLMEKGKMLSVLASVEVVKKECGAEFDSSIDVAAVNTPNMCVFSGSCSKIDRLTEILKEKSIKCSVLNTSHAYHSRYMKEAADKFKNILDTVTFHKPEKDYLSNVYGTWLKEQTVPDAAYWMKHIMSTVQFGAEINCIMESMKNLLFIEVGPGNSLSTLIKCNPNYSMEHKSVSILPTYKKSKEEQEHFINAIADLWRMGVTVNWQEFYLFKLGQGRVVSLPDYAYQKEKLYINMDKGNNSTPLVINKKKIDNTNLTREQVSQKVLESITEILGNKDTNESDNLFRLGADSVKIVILTSKLKNEFDMDISIKEILSSESIGHIVEYICKGINTKADTSIVSKAEIKDRYEVSSIQKRMYLLSEMDEEGLNYNIAEAVRIFGDIDVKVMEMAVKILISRHANLRSYFNLEDGRIYQYVDDAAESSLELYDLRDSLNKAASLAAVKKNFIKVFHLGKAPLFKIGVVLLKEDEKIILLNAHHIIVDGTSMNIILEDLMNIILGNPLKEINYNYFDYINWMNSNANSEELIKQNTYWKEVFKDKVPILNIPLDFERGELQSFEGKSSFYVLKAEILKQVETICKEEKVSLYTYLLAALNIFLSKITGDEDIVIGCPVDSRRKKEFYNVVGMFVNTLPIRNYLNMELTFHEFLSTVKDNMFNAFENQDLQMEVVINDLKANINKRRNPLFDVMLVEQNLEYEKVKERKLKVCYENYEKKTSMLDFTIYFHKSKSGIQFEIEYCTKLFKQQSIDFIFNGFKTVLEQIIYNSEVSLADIKLANNYKRLEYFEEDEIEFSF